MHYLHYYLQVARELRAEDHYQYLRAYSAGLQEWVEALSFYDFLRNNNISSFAFVSGQLVFGAAELEAEEGEQLSVTVPQSEVSSYTLSVHTTASGNNAVCRIKGRVNQLK